jgi:hypothetical protein
MKLSSDQIAIIRMYVDKSAISIDSLKDDVLDHLCCVVEINMERGKSFNNVVQEALVELAPDGLDEIQRETVFLLNSTKIIRMKKMMYAIGLITAISMTMGLTFKILHMPGAEELFNFGFFGLVLVFLPMITIDRYKRNLHKALSERLRFVLGFLSAVLIGFSVLFKIFHYQGADVLLLVGISFFSFGFLPFLFFSMYKKSVS